MKVIELKGDLTEQLISQLRDALLDRTDVELRIDSPGGDRELKDEVLAVMEEITDGEFSIAGVVLGEASSSAFMILQGCTIRKALRSATLMFHPLQVCMPQGGYVMGGETDANPYEPEYLSFLADLSRGLVSPRTLSGPGATKNVSLRLKKRSSTGSSMRS